VFGDAESPEPKIAGGTLFLDANVWRHSRANLVFLGAADLGLCRLPVSEKVQQEWVAGREHYNVKRTNFMLGELFGRLKTRFGFAFDEATEPLLEHFVLTDKKDAAIAASALAVEADVLVTFNHKHFDPVEMSNVGIPVYSPATVLAQLLLREPFFWWTFYQLETSRDSMERRFRNMIDYWHRNEQWKSPEISWLLAYYGKRFMTDSLAEEQH